MGKILHVIGTDTGVGKTAVACALARAFKRKGLDVGVCKPFASGCPKGELPADARFLIGASGSKDDESLVSPVRFETPASPWAAALAEGVDSGINYAYNAASTLAARHKYLLIEGIGGLLVPLAAGLTYLDFLERLGGKILLVARPGLGTINHCLLTLEAAKGRGITTSGVVFNRTSDGSDPSEGSNPEAVRLFGGVEVLGTAPFTEAPESRLELAFLPGSLPLI